MTRDADGLRRSRRATASRRDAAFGAVAPPLHLASSYAFEGFERPQGSRIFADEQPNL